MLEEDCLLRGESASSVLYTAILCWVSMFDISIVSSHRDAPSRLDRDVFFALGATEIDPLKYPSIHKWKSTMESYSSAEMQRYVCRLLF